MKDKKDKDKKNVSLSQSKHYIGFYFIILITICFMSRFLTIWEEPKIEYYLKNSTFNHKKHNYPQKVYLEIRAGLYNIIDPAVNFFHPDLKYGEKNNSDNSVLKLFANAFVPVHKYSYLHTLFFFIFLLLCLFIVIILIKSILSKGSEDLDTDYSSEGLESKSINWLSMLQSVASPLYLKHYHIINKCHGIKATTGKPGKLKGVEKDVEKKNKKNCTNGTVY